MQIQSFHLTRENTISILGDFAESEFGIHDEHIIQSIQGDFDRFTREFKEDLCYILETPYIDKVYRDSYYTYFASKFDDYSRNCLKISIWDKIIEYSDFDSNEKIDLIRPHFLGFMVIRPTYPNIIGRNALSPLVFKKNNFRVCLTTIGVTVNGVKFEVKAFPASSQDGETMMCAEVCIWQCLEYFGFRYAEYSPILPSDIIKVLKMSTIERQLPSQGLDIGLIASALKGFGFGPKLYSKEVYKEDDEFFSLLSIYIESGIPVILALEGKKPHAVVVIGRPVWDDIKMKELKESITLDKARYNDITICDWHTVSGRKYVFLNDNLPPYSQQELDKSWTDYEALVNHFVVPLHARIYLEAYNAKKFIEKLLLNKLFFPLKSGTNVVTRLLLASSRTYKNWIKTSAIMDDDLKQIIVETAMPKFIYLCELGKKHNFLQKKATGLIILDATEPNLNFFNPLILVTFEGNFLTFAPHSESNEIDSQSIRKKVVLQNFKKTFNEFDVFEENLSIPT